MSAGLDPERFWHLAPRELDAIMKGAGARLRREENERIRHAWHAAQLTAYAPSRPAQFPKLDKLLVKDPKRRRVPSAEEDAAALFGWVESVKARKARRAHGQVR